MGVKMKVDKAIKATFNTNLIILNGFLVALLVGTILLMLPVSSASGNGTDFITALFTATTSLCVTGLVVVPTYAYWSIFGKVIILILIQLGGLGIISFTIGFLIIIGKKISLKGCTGNNLKNVNVDFPLGKLICVTGVSGSGKSSLVNGTLHPILSAYFYNALAAPLPYKSIEGMTEIDKVVVVDQSPLGKSPRSNPATYTGLFTDIRKIFEKLPESQIRGYTAGRFSFNVSGGRCEVCKGAGVKTIEMNFLPDVYVHCEACDGKRYNKETLEVRYKGKSIGDVLNLTINQAVEFFENLPHLQSKLKMLQDVGLGYIKIGQPCTTLSGGESQRIKLATELSKKDTGSTLYILDEPTTGLHFEDINILLGVLQKLVDKGNTVIVIEHNLDVIKVADYLIDMGPGGGKMGGSVVCTGTPEEVAQNKKSVTAPFLREELGMK